VRRVAKGRPGPRALPLARTPAAQVRIAPNPVSLPARQAAVTAPLPVSGIWLSDVPYPAMRGRVIGNSLLFFPVRQKKIAMDERLLAQSTKIKAMDALKVGIW